MDPNEKMERQRAAQQRLRAQQRRAGQLRGRAIAISLIAFVLLWGVVFAQMATGNDPVLGASSSAIVKPAATAAAEAIETTAPRELEPEVVKPEPVEEELVEVEPEPEPAPVTTSQS
jgi:outer membrane biosynthesis protein TonB